MREIKFRQWIYGKQFHYWGFTKPDIECFIGPVNMQDPNEQYTGLKDRNGKDVWEGDILKLQGIVGVVEWCDFACGFRPKGMPEWYTMSGPGKTEWEVIGNIHEHAHLLEAPNAQD